MTLRDCDTEFNGLCTAVSGDAATHRRLADLGLIGSSVRVRAVRRSAVLADFSDSFSAVVNSYAAECMTVEVKK